MFGPIIDGIVLILATMIVTGSWSRRLDQKRGISNNASAIRKSLEHGDG